MCLIQVLCFCTYLLNTFTSSGYLSEIPSLLLNDNTQPLSLFLNEWILHQRTFCVASAKSAGSLASYPLPVACPHSPFSSLMIFVFFISISSVFVSQACCVTCCGQTQIRMYKVGERTTVGSPSPSGQMLSASS